jgi:hypothetical protein
VGIKSLPIIQLTDDIWNPGEEMWGTKGSGTKSYDLRQTRAVISKVHYSGGADTVLSQISDVYDAKTFCKKLIASVNITRDEGYRVIGGVITSDRHSKATPEEVARIWDIGLESAKETLKVTTQHGVRTAMHPMTRRLRVDHLHLHRHQLKGTWFVDTLLSKTQSKLGNSCANVFTQGKFTRVIPMTSRKDAGRS